MSHMVEAISGSSDMDNVEIRVGGRVVKQGLNAFEAEMFLAGFVSCCEIYGHPAPPSRVQMLDDK